MSDKISRESAQIELDKLYDYYEIDKEEFEDVNGESDEQKANRAIQKLQEKIIRGVMKGRISFNDEDGFQITLIKKVGDPIVFKELDGYAKAEMSKKKESDNYGKIFALMGKMSGLGEHAVKKLKGPELSLVEAIGTMLLMS